MGSKFTLLMLNLVRRRENSLKFLAIDSLLNRLFHATVPLYRIDISISSLPSGVECEEKNRRADQGREAGDILLMLPFNDTRFWYHDLIG